MVMQRLSRSLVRHTSQLVTRPAKSSTQFTSTGRCLSTSPWSQFEMAPVDPIVGLNEIFQKDDFPQKVIVGVGAYRDDMGKPYVLPCVREAERILMDKNLDMEYTGIVSPVFGVDRDMSYHAIVTSFVGVFVSLFINPYGSPLPGL